MSSHTNIEIKETLRALACRTFRRNRAKLNGSLRLSNATQKAVVYFDAGAKERSSQIREAQAAEDFENGFKFFDGRKSRRRSAVSGARRASSLRAYYGKALSTDLGKIQSRNRNAEYRHVVAEFFLSVNLPKRTEGEMNRLLTISPNNIEAKLMLDNLANRQ